MCRSMVGLGHRVCRSFRDSGQGEYFLHVHTSSPFLLPSLLFSPYFPLLLPSPTPSPSFLSNVTSSAVFYNSSSQRHRGYSELVVDIPQGTAAIFQQKVCIMIKTRSTDDDALAESWRFVCCTYALFGDSV